MSDAPMTIGEVARDAGTTTDTIRFYEREGLLEKPRRSHTGYRLYAPPALARLRFIRKARQLGLSLGEIRELLHMAKAGRAPCCRVRELLAERLSALDQKISDLKRLRNDISRFTDSIVDLPDQADTSPSVCALIDGFPASGMRSKK